MELEKVKRRKAISTKTVSISIKVSQEVSDWMKENTISPTLVFTEAVAELMEDKEHGEEQIMDARTAVGVGIIAAIVVLLFVLFIRFVRV